MDAWVDLLNTYVRRALTRNGLDPHLSRLWISVGKDVSRKWSCKAMPKIARMSEEHLRRLCLQVHSQSAMHPLRH